VTQIKEDANDFYNGRACVKLNGKWGIVDKTGVELIPAIYDYLLNFPYDDEVTPAKFNDKWGLIDTTGTIVIPLIYDTIMILPQGRAIVELNGKCGFVNKTGTIAIPPKYDNVFSWNKFVKVELNDKWGLVEGHDVEILPIIYDAIYFIDEKTVHVELNGEDMIIDL
jgi:hypothetical protein